ncbi:MAG: ABC transporter ATP-binding protein [Candidatus Hodarchaeales archaeon]
MLKEKKYLILTLVFSFLFALTWSTTPYFTGIVIDLINSTLVSGNEEFDKIVIFSLLIILISFVSYVFSAISWFVSEYYTGQVTKRLRSNLFEVFQKQSHKYYDKFSSGDLLSKATNDVMLLWDLFWGLPFLGTIAFTQLLFIFLFLFYANFIVGIISLVSIPIMIFIIFRFEKNYIPISKTSREQFGNLNRVIQENVEGAAVSRVFSAKEKEIKRFTTINSGYRNLQFKLARLRGSMTPQLSILSNVTASIVLIFGSMLVLDNVLTLGSLVASVFFVKRLAGPLIYLSNVSEIWGEASGAETRVLGILESTPDITEDPSAIELPTHAQGRIEFRNVNFSYQKAPVLHNVNLKIPGKSSCAILGATGSGKSSLINLIPRFYDVLDNDGEILLDGIDIRKLKLDSLRKAVGFVDQETFLFSRSVHDNIAFGCPRATRYEVIEVAKIARAHEFIKKLPKGYDTVIGERGVTLSGGQRQRISIARALLANPLIVIFDDSLSSVDVKTEIEIRKATKDLLKNRTTIIVTQRLSTIKTADKIIILDKGKIVEAGTHNELLALNGVYSRLVHSQQDGLINLALVSR